MADDLLTLTRLAVGYAKSTRAPEPDPPHAWSNGLAGYLVDDAGLRWCFTVMPADGDRSVQRGIFADAERFLDTGEFPAKSFPMGMVAIVTGGRSGAKQAFVSMAMDAWLSHHRPVAIVHGACKDPRHQDGDPPATEVEALERDDAPEGWSVDMCADRWARARGVSVRPMPADWHPGGGPLDRSAGPRRNAEMRSVLCAARDLGRPVAVLAFPGGTGTGGMVQLALDASLPVWRATKRGWFRERG